MTCKQSLVISLKKLYNLHPYQIVLKNLQFF